MDTNRWWGLIERSDGDGDKLIELLANELTVDEILSFDRFLHERIRDAYRSDLWEVAYIMNGGCSDDGFDYFIGWLIGRGRKHYEAALANPEAAADGVGPDDEPFENEAVWYVPSNAGGIKTGQPKDHHYKIAPKVPRPPEGDGLDADTAPPNHPDLAERFGG